MIKLKDILNEVENSVDLSISKIEEQFGLQLIIKKLIPHAVNTYNKRVVDPDGFIKIEDVIRGLKKSMNDVDEKRYTSVFKIGNITKSFRFGIQKRYIIKVSDIEDEEQKPVLCVGDYNITTTQAFYWYNVNDLISGKEPQKLYESKIYCRINKIQEQEGLQYIKKLLIKKAVDTFNKLTSGYNVTEEEVQKKLRKIVDYRPLTSVEGRYVCDVVAYGSIIDRFKDNYYPEGLKFRFDISIDGEGRLLTSYTTPLSNVRSWFNVYDLEIPKSLRENNEIGNLDDFFISKIEEQYAIEYYKRHVLPKDVNAYNSDNLRWKKLEQTTTDKVINNLRKVKHFKTDGVFPDKIIYKSVMGNIKTANGMNYPLEFIVEIVKEKGKLSIKHQYPFMSLVFTTKLTENIEDRITKLDEQYAYTYMIRNIIPHIIEEQYYKHLKKAPTLYPERKYPRNITAQDIIKKLRKIRKDINLVEYESVINDRISFEFIIVKEQQLDPLDAVLGTKKEIWNLHMMCGVKGPLSVEYKWYDINYTPTVIKENTEHVYSISKMDDQRAVEFIRRNLIPDIVDSYNETCRGYTHQPKANVSDVNKTLRRISCGKTPRLGADEIIYRVLMYNGTNNEPYEFRVYKNYEGKLFVNNRAHVTSHRVV